MHNQSEHEQFVMDRRENDFVDGHTDLKGYALGGKEVNPLDRTCLAKRALAPSGGTRYWLKRATLGPDAGYLYNPHSPMFDEERGAYQFFEANQDAFEAYMRFLTTGNTVHLRQAEREK